jgi:hypothetical protein
MPEAPALLRPLREFPANIPEFVALGVLQTRKT